MKTTFEKNDIVQLNIPAARPIRTLNGALHESGNRYRVLGFHGMFLRLSRCSDHAKLIIQEESVVNVANL